MSESPFVFYRNISEKKEGITNNLQACEDAYTSKEYSTMLTYDEYSAFVNYINDDDNIVTVGDYEGYLAWLDYSNNSTVDNNNNNNSYNQCNDGWWKCAWSFLRSGNRSNHQFGTNTGADRALNDIKSMIFDVGNLIFLLVTAYLGVKYIWGGVDSKFTVKNSLMTLIVAAIVFYGWDSVTKILDIPELLTGSAAASGETAMANKIYNTIMYIINFAAVGGIIYIGIRYMMAGADGKAELKLKGIPVVMGIMMVYGTLNFINFILKIVEGL